MAHFKITGPPNGDIDINIRLDVYQLTELILEEISLLSGNESSGWAGMFIVTDEFGATSTFCADTGHIHWWLNENK